MLDVPFDEAGPFMPSMGLALGPVDEAPQIALGKTSLAKSAPRTYRRTVSTTLTFVKPGTADVDAVIAEVKRISVGINAPIVANEQITVAKRSAALIEIKHLEQGIPVLLQAAVFVANGVLHTLVFASLDGPKVEACRKQFRHLLNSATAFGDPKE